MSVWRFKQAVRALRRLMNRRSPPVGELGHAPVLPVDPPVEGHGVFAQLTQALAQMRQAAPKKGESLQRLWTMPKPPPGVLPEGEKMAMDSAIDGFGAWAVQNSLFAEGQVFLGYPYLAELSQRAEYRVIVKTWAQEMTRKWIRLVSTGDTDIEDKTEKLKELEAELKRLNLQDLFRQAFECDGYFGRAHLYIDLGVEYDNAAELKTPIGNGGPLSAAKIKKGQLQGLRLIEPVWTYPNSYNANNPLKFDFFRPTTWFVMGREIHDTRMLTFIGRPMPDLLKPAYSFGGLSLSQMAKPYIDNWLRVRQSVSDIISNYSVMIMMTDLTQFLNTGAAVSLAQRAELFNVARDNKGLMIADKNTEDIKNVSVPLGSLDHLQAQAQEHQAAVSELPLVMITGITPSGLNASSKEDIEVFQDKVAARQEAEGTENLSKIINLAQINLWGAVDPDIGFIWEPLKTETESERVASRKSEIEGLGMLLDRNVIDVQETRTVLAADEEGPFASLDLSDAGLPLQGSETDELGDPTDTDHAEHGTAVNVS